MEHDADEDEFRPRQPWPWWVATGLWGLPSRGWAWGFVWLALALAVGCVAYGFASGYVPAFFGGGFVFAALWYFAAIRWVDRHGEWP